MTISMLKQNAQILLEVCQNYDKLKENKQTTPEKIKQFKMEFLYLLTAIDKLEKEERKNAQ